MNTINISINEFEVMEKILKRGFRVNKTNEKYMNSLRKHKIIVQRKKRNVISKFGMQVLNVLYERIER